MTGVCALNPVFVPQASQALYSTFRPRPLAPPRRFQHLPEIVRMTHNFTAAELAVKSLGPCRIDSPLLPLLEGRQRTFHNVDEEDRVLFDDTLSGLSERNLPVDQLPAFEPAGPRRKIFFDPSEDPCRYRNLRRAVSWIQRRDSQPRSRRSTRAVTACTRSTASATATRVSSPNTAGPCWTFRRPAWRASTSKAAHILRDIARRAGSRRDRRDGMDTKARH